MKFRFISNLAAGCAVLAACASPDNSERSSNRTSHNVRIEVGAPVPDYATVSITGDSVSLAGQKGKTVLLNIWATWCHPCRTEIPELIAIHERYRARGVELIGVTIDADAEPDVINAFMKEYHMTFPIWRDVDDRISNMFLAVGVPATFLIDSKGILRWRKTGPILPNDSSLSAAIERSLRT